MATWSNCLIILLSLLPQQSLEEARERMRAISRELTESVAEQPPKQVAVKWDIKKIPVVTANYTQNTTVHYLVSEDWCTYCPAAKRKFINEGHDQKNIIDIATARSMGVNVSSIPHRFTKIVSVPAPYRSSVWPPKWDVNGVKYPSKQQLLDHLRNNPNHAGKHWQEYDLESWTKEQLAALHSDDHDGIKIVSSAPTVEKTIEVTVDSEPSVKYTLRIIEEYLQNGYGDDSLTYSSFFNFDIDTPDFVPSLLHQLATTGKWSKDSLTVAWAEKWKLENTANKFSFSPSLKVTYQKSVIKFTTSLNYILLKNDGKTIELDLSPSPNITINFR